MGVINRSRFFIIITALILAVVFVSFSAFLASQHMRRMQDQRLDHLKQAVQIARNSIEPILVQYRNGGIARESALEEVRSIVRRMVYQDHLGNNYIFMSSYDGTMLVQPFEPDLEMTDVWDLQDHYGKYIIRALVTAAKSETGQGYVSYYYQRPGEEAAEEKISFVIGIPELECYIGTGQYMADIRRSQSDYILKVSLLTFFLMVLLALLVRFSIREIEAQNVKLRKTESELTAIFNSTFQFIGTLSVDGKLTRVNDTALKFINQNEREVLGKYFWETPWWQDKRYIDELRESIRKSSEGEFCRFETINYSWDNTRHHIDFSLTPILNHRGDVDSLLAEGRDITERKKAEQQYEVFFQRNVSPVFWLELRNPVPTNLPPEEQVDMLFREAYFLDCSETNASFYGFDRSELLGKPLTCIWPSDAIHPGHVTYQYFHMFIGADYELYGTESSVISPSGEQKWFLGNLKGIVENDCLVRVWGSQIDITSLKDTEEKLTTSLREKETLIRELYHRTKNNMQVAAAMLNMKALVFDDESVTNAFREIEKKILGMALVHQSLYESGDLSYLSLKSYIQELINTVEQSESYDMIFQFDGEDISVLLDTAMPLGIILNELMINTEKHARVEDGQTRVNIRLYLNSEQNIVLEFSDNGPGLPENHALNESNGMGLQIVKTILRNQLNGEIEFENRNGLHSRITLGEQLYKSRI